MVFLARSYLLAEPDVKSVSWTVNSTASAFRQQKETATSLLLALEAFWKRSLQEERRSFIPSACLVRTASSVAELGIRGLES